MPARPRVDWFALDTHDFEDGVPVLLTDGPRVCVAAWLVFETQRYEFDMGVFPETTVKRGWCIGFNDKGLPLWLETNFIPVAWSPMPLPIDTLLDPEAQRPLRETASKTIASVSLGGRVFANPRKRRNLIL